jgi:cytochrome P450
LVPSQSEQVSEHIVGLHEGHGLCLSPHPELRVGRTKPPDDREDFLYKLLLLLEQNGKATRGDMINACGSNIRAASDTTAISLTAAIAHLSMNPTVLAKLREELEDATNSGTASDPITFKEAQKLPYLHAVIRETIRIHLLSVHP